MGRKQAKARTEWKRRAGNQDLTQKGDPDEWYTIQTAAPLSEIVNFVQWYNLRRYASRTFISKIANLPDLRDAFD